VDDPSVNAHLDAVRQAHGIEVRAFVAAAPARPLRWRLETVSRSSGGTSNVSQSGSTQGSAGPPVSVTVVSPDSRGRVTLFVYDGGAEVARSEVDLIDVER
jgi:hypothetical protein